MTKKTILLASAAAGLLLTTGQAFATDISGTGIYSAVKSSGTSTAVALASELRFQPTASTTTALASTGSLTYKVAASTGNSFPNNVPLILTLDVSNAIFNDAASSAVVVSATGSCTGTASALSGVAANATQATYLITLQGCTATSSDGLDISLPIRVTGAGAVTSSATLQTQSGLLNVDGGKATATFITLSKAFTASVSATGTAAVADVSSGYQAFTDTTATGILAGTVTLGVNSSVYTNLSASATASTADIASVTYVATANSFAGFNLGYGNASTLFGATATTSATVRTYTATAAAGSTSIYIVDNTNTATGSGIAQNASLTETGINIVANVDLLTAGSNVGQFVDFTASGAINGVVRNGASVLVPWIGSATQAAANGTSSTIRIGNTATSATGRVFAQLVSSVGGVTSGVVQVAPSVPASGELIISQQNLQDAFGVNFVRGDVQIIIEAQPKTLTFKRREVTAQGNYEVSLGSAAVDSGK